MSGQQSPEEERVDMVTLIEQQGLTLFSDGGPESKKAEELIVKYDLDNFCKVVENR